MRILRIAIFCLAGLFSVAAFSQKATVKASLDTNAILIGQQFRLLINLNQDADVSVAWPAVENEMKFGVEWVENEKSDTTFSENKDRINFKRSYLLTVFDSGKYQIPALPFSISNGSSFDTLYTEPLYINVDRPQVDTTQEIRDIKGPMAIPFDWREVLPYVLLFFAVIGVLAVAVALLVRYIARKKRKSDNVPAYVPPSVPADERALAALQELGSRELWQRGNNKEYYTILTDILRVYIKDVYHVDAPEMLTEDIIGHLRFKDIHQGDKETLRSVLVLADMVKFAKVTPTATENTQALTEAEHFVKETARAIAEKNNIQPKKGGVDEH